MKRGTAERLFDIYVGHWDPTLSTGDGSPCPAGAGCRQSLRDGAFARYDGLITVYDGGLPAVRLVRSGYDRALGVTPQLRVIDRRI
jgi:hypothetical protein